MKKAVQDYIKAYNNVFAYFSADGDFYLKPLTSYFWSIRDEDGWHIVKYWNDESKVSESAIVKKNGSPQIYVTQSYTMVVAIECVKVGFIFRNANKFGK